MKKMYVIIQHVSYPDTIYKKQYVRGVTDSLEAVLDFFEKYEIPYVKDKIQNSIRENNMGNSTEVCTDCKNQYYEVLQETLNNMDYCEE